MNVINIKIYFLGGNFMKEDAMNNLYNSIIFIVIAVIFLIVYIAKNKVNSIEDFKKKQKNTIQHINDLFAFSWSKIVFLY